MSPRLSDMTAFSTVCPNFVQNLEAALLGGLLDRSLETERHQYDELVGLRVRSSWRYRHSSTSDSSSTRSCTGSDGGVGVGSGAGAGAAAGGAARAGAGGSGGGGSSLGTQNHISISIL